MKTTIICGLGNPGEKFKNTRHNIGFMAIDEFAGKNNFPDFKLNKKFNSLVSESVLNEEKIILLKPQTFMNESGKAVKKIIENCKATLRGARFASREIGNLLVIHDDLDLLLGKLKIVKNRGSAGHKGVESIIETIGTKEFIRLRIGVKPPEAENRKQKTEKFVLKKFSKKEEKAIKAAIEMATNALDFLLKQGLEKTMNKYN